MAEAQQTKTCRKKRTSKDRMTAERTTAKNKTLRASRQLRREAKKRIHLEQWARRNGVALKNTIDLKNGKAIRRLVWLVRNDAVYAAEQA
jgi:hypothetical protein